MRQLSDDMSEIEFLDIGVPVIVAVLLILLLVAICLLLRRAGVHIGCTAEDREGKWEVVHLQIFSF